MINISFSFAWWIIPLIITIFGLLISIYDYHTDKSPHGGLIGFVIFMLCVFISSGILLGHFVL